MSKVHSLYELLTAQQNIIKDLQKEVQVMEIEIMP